MTGVEHGPDEASLFRAGGDEQHRPGRRSIERSERFGDLEQSRRAGCVVVRAVVDVPRVRIERSLAPEAEVVVVVGGGREQVETFFTEVEMGAPGTMRSPVTARSPTPSASTSPMATAIVEPCASPKGRLGPKRPLPSLR